MRALTVRQPWAWGLIHGPKRIENRTWNTSYRGPLLIHAGKSRTALGDDEGTLGAPAALVFGAILGLVELIDCVPFDRVRGEPFADGPWCWVTANPRPLAESYPYRGMLGLWAPPAGVLSLLPALATAVPPGQ